MIIIQPDQTLRKSEYRDQTIEVVDSLLPYLDERVEFHEDLTLGDLFKFIERDKEVFAGVFLCQLGRHDLNLYIDEIDKETIETSKENTIINYLELSWVTNHDIMDGETFFDTYIDFSGVGQFRDKIAHGDNKWRETSVAVEFTPLNELKQYPLKLNEKIKIFKPYDHDRAKQLRREEKQARKEKNKKALEEISEEYMNMFESKKNIILKAYQQFTVYEAIGEILSEVSFCGTPNDRTLKLSELDQIHEEIKDTLKEKGTGLFKSWDGLKDELDDKN